MPQRADPVQFAGGDDDGRVYRGGAGRTGVAMAIVSLTLELIIEQAHSLKDRRQVVRSLKEKLRHGFNISVAELDEAVTWQSATIGITAISRSRDYLTGLMRQVEDAAVRISNDLGAQIADSWCTFLEEEAEE
jgi:uncharacterized protein YlxP (DUF503 family)